MLMILEMDAYINTFYVDDSFLAIYLWVYIYVSITGLGLFE